MSVNSAGGSEAGAASSGAGQRHAPDFTILGTPVRALLAARGRTASFLATTLAAENDRIVLWLPVAFAAGIVVYFSLPAEPPGWLTVLLVFGGLGPLALVFRRDGWRLIASGVLAVAVGFALAQWRTHAAAAPRITSPLGPVQVEGTVVSAEPVERGWRLLLEAPAVQGLAAERTPLRLRISVRTRPPDPGRQVRLRAMLMPLPGPASPGGYDFQRRAWFERLGGVGYSLGPVQAVEPVGLGTTDWGHRVEAMRQAIDRRIQLSIAGSEKGDARSALASALITGMRGAVPEEIDAAMRNSGLAHLLSISGLHLSLVAGLVFFVVRAGLALVPPLALRWQTRKLAAAVALLVAGFYLLLSGAAVPTQRSFIMLAFGLGAILADRLQVSMRPVALAALAVMVLSPESVLGPSFQLSFGAVIALVAAYEAAGQWRARRRQAGLPPFPLVVSYPAGLAFTSLVATVATTPIGIHHFHQAALYAIPANMIAVPVTGAWVMPWGMVGVLAMPFGAEQLPFRAMALGIDLVVWAAFETASWPGAVTAGLIMPPFGLVLLGLGGLWLAFWQTGWRWVGAPVAVAGMATVLWTSPPDILLAGDGRLAGARDEDGRLLVSSLRAAGFEREAWLRQTGARAAEAWPGPPEASSNTNAMSCDEAGCLYRRHGRLVLFARSEDSLVEDCAQADLVVVMAPLSSRLVARSCGDVPVLRYRDLKRDGAHALRVAESGIAVTTVAAERGDRPWTRFDGN